jgi:uncharacterized membrane protein
MNDQFPDRKRFEISGQTQTFGLDYSMAACLCYLPLPPIGLIAAVLWLVTEPKASLYVRFHAIQSLMVFGGLIAANILVQIINFLGIIPIIGDVFKLVSGIAWFVFAGVWFILTVMLTIKAKQGEMYKLPMVGDIAENLAAN